MASPGHALDADGQILGHGTRLNGLYTHILQGLGKFGKGIVVVQLGTMGQPTCPSKDGSCKKRKRNIMDSSDKIIAFH